MNTDFSVAPEIAQLADPCAPPPHVTTAPRTDGRITRVPPRVRALSSGYSVTLCFRPGADPGNASADSQGTSDMICVPSGV